MKFLRDHNKFLDQAFDELNRLGLREETETVIAELNERKMEIVNDYEKCVNKSETAEGLAKCEALLKGAEGL